MCCLYPCPPFLGAFEKLRKATINFDMSVCSSVRPSVRMEQIGSHWTDFHKIRYLSIFRKSITEVLVSFKYDRNKQIYIFEHISLNIIKRHIDNRELLLTCILLLSHSLIFLRLIFYQYMVVFRFNTVIYVFLL